MYIKEYFNKCVQFYVYKALIKFNIVQQMGHNLHANLNIKNSLGMLRLIYHSLWAVYDMAHWLFICIDVYLFSPDIDTYNK